MPDELRIYHRYMPHWRLHGAIYFVTWCLDRGQQPLTVIERDRLAQVLRHFDRIRYELGAYVVMNDHVHVLLQPHPAFALERIMHSWKSYSAALMRGAQRTGRIWQREYYDRIVRNEAELRDKVEYIRTNPQRRWPGIDEYPWVWCRYDVIG
jgi:putative transposase